MAPVLPHRWAARWQHGLAQLPQQCHSCRHWPSAGLLCTQCWQRFAPQPLALRCTGCALPLPASAAHAGRCGRCLRRPPVWQRALAWCDYAYPWADVLHDWKFAQHPSLALHIAHWLRSSAAIAQAVAQADALVPIPLSAQRLRERGYNPAALLAQQLGRAAAGPKVLLHSLVRTQHSPAQSGLSRTQRLRNLQHAFAVPAAQRQRLQGQAVLLVDDVMTTGATLGAAAHALQRAGCGPITVLCVARTLPKA